MKDLFKKIKGECQNKILEKLGLFIVICLIALFSIYPYMNNRMIYAHDLSYHLNRIMSLSENIKQGQLPSMIHSNLLNGLGYASPLFYSELFMFVPAIIYLITGAHIISVYKLFVFIITVGTMYSMYYCVKKLYKNKIVAIFASIIYTFSLYRLTDIYVRAAIGELFAFMFLPLITIGFHEIVFGENKRWWIISLGILGIVYSHLLSFVFIVVYILVLCILNVNRIFKDKTIFKNLFIAGVASIILAIGYMGPMLEQKLNYTFYVDANEVDSPIAVQERAMSLSMLFGSKVIGGYATDSNVDAGCMSEGIGIVLIICAAITIVRKDIWKKENRFELQLYLIGLITLIMTTKVFPWDKLAFMSIIQFPFRLNLFPVLTLSIVGANSVYLLLDKKEELLKVLCLVVLVFNSYILDNLKINFNPDRFYSFEVLLNGVDAEIASKEYLPEGCKLEDLEDCNLYSLENKETFIDFTQVGNKVVFDYDQDNSKLEINVPLLYYKGYKATLEKEDGSKVVLNVDRNKDNGHVLLTNDENIKGKITVRYSLTAIQMTSYIITVLSTTVLVIYIIVENKKLNGVTNEK